MMHVFSSGRRTKQYQMRLQIAVLTACVGLTFASHQQFLWNEEDHRPQISDSKRLIRATEEGVRQCDDPNNIVLPPTATNTTQRLMDLRSEMAKQSYSGYIVPESDSHLSEYLSQNDKKRAWISGFFGSAGTAVITMDKAALWTDGRYFIQAERELDCNWILMKIGEMNVPSIGEWLIDELADDQVVAANPFLYSIDGWQSLETTLIEGNLVMSQSIPDLMDSVWSDRPPPSGTHVIVHPITYAGKDWIDKLSATRAIMENNNVDYLLLTILDEIAWFFNLRGNDIPNTPVFTSYAIVSRNAEIYLFANTEFFQYQEMADHLNRTGCETASTCVMVLPYDEARPTLLGLATGSTGRFWLPRTGSNYGMYSAVDTVLQYSIESPLKVAKAVKNPTEIEVIKRAHIYDAVALCEYFMWLEVNVPLGKVDEISGQEKLREFRAAQPANKGPSFDTISASGPNAALSHYKSSEYTNRNLTTTELYLVDSGGQYFEGTTDVTRTMHFGQPTDFERETFTRALMGMIDVEKAIFPFTKLSTDLDILARRYLYEVGLEYRHGTGHGVGQYLAIHEYPPYIGNYGESSRWQPGMTTSVEPGYYQDGDFGLRHENMNVVVKANTPHQFGGYDFYTFEAMTLVPFQRKMIMESLFDDAQLERLNSYHGKVLEVIGDEAIKQNKPEIKEWLEEATLPILRSGASLAKPSLAFAVAIAIANCLIHS